MNPNPVTGGRLTAIPSQAVLNRTWDGLSAQHRAVLQAAIDCNGLYVKMAVALKVPLGTVKSRLHRARAVMRKLSEGGTDV